MALALNRFKTHTATLTTSSATIYTAPTGYTGIILYAHITNYAAAATTLTMSHVRSSTTNEIIKGNENIAIQLFTSIELNSFSFFDIIDADPYAKAAKIP